MLIDLDVPTIVSSFKHDLSTFTFIPKSGLRDIKKQLDILAGLRGHPKRTIKTDAALWLWDYFVSRALNSITPNTRGYHKLSAYFKHYSHYEQILFAIDENHRDHVIHSIWVMMIGFYLSRQCHPLSLLRYPAIQFDRANYIKKIKEAEKLMASYEDALLVLVFLTHDLGYPIQKTTIANEVMSKMTSNFGLLPQTKFSYQFTVLHQTAIDELLNTLSTVILWLPNGQYRLGINPGIRLDYSKTLEQFDHGIMSAYLIQRYLDFICDTMSWYRHIPDYTEKDIKMAVLRALIISWLSAIADHTNNNKYFYDLDDITVLLIISDELDEFSRYSHHRTRDTWVTVNCKTSINCTRHSLDFSYKHKNRTRDETVSFFRGKVRRLIDCFDLDKESISKISIKCVNSSSKPDNNVGYYFEKRFNTGDGFVKRLRGKPNYDVRGFLNEFVNLN